ncbi:unnamed protein product [Caenorhabditis nigoni]
MMKLQSIILVLICGVIYQRSCEKLDDVENGYRLETCGGMFLPQPSSNEYGVDVNLNETWLVSVGQINQTKLPHIPSVGFPISKRHILTSSQVVITGSQQWALDGSTFDGNCTNKHAEVPANIVANLNVTFAQRTFAAVQGKFFFACDTGHFAVNYQPMLLELSEPLGLTPFEIPCLADKSFEFRKENWKSIREAHSYGLDDGHLKHHNVTIEHFITSRSKYGMVYNSRWAYTTKYDAVTDRGGPLLYNSSGRAVVVGLKASSPNDGKKGSKGIYFYNLAYIQKAVCEYSGVCPPIIPTTTTTTTTTTITTTTTVPPPTSPPPTKNPNVLESSTQRNTSISPRIPPNPNSNLTDYVETDFEESEKDFKVEVEYVDELDERELEVYFERDKFNGSRGIKMDKKCVRNQDKDLLSKNPSNPNQFSTQNERRIVSNRQNMLFKQLLIASLLLGIVLADTSKHYNEWTQEEKNAANTVVIICIVVGVLICLSAIGAGGFFYMMRKNNANQGGQVMVVR